MNPPINRENLRDALITVALGSAMALALNGCAATPPPAAPTAAQLAPVPAPTPAPEPRITGATILAEQSKEVQDAIEHYRRGAWPSFHSAHGELWPYSDRMEPVTIDCAPLHITDILLQPGETITDVALGDSERWLATPAAGGNPTDATPHVLIKAELLNLQTNASVFTDRHTYRFTLRSHARTSLDWVQFYYPDEVQAQMRAADAAPAVDSEPADPIAPSVDPGRLNFAYKVSGPHLPWTPVKVFDDGTRTWIEMPQTTSPITPALLGGNGTMLNYRVRGQYYVVDSLFSRAELVSGVGRQQDRVTITRSE
jgi:P-type conjugative transfer protein TrbG